MAKLIAGTTDIQDAIAYEQNLSPGIYDVRLTLTSPLSQGELNDLHEHFLSSGVDVSTITQRRKGNKYQIAIRYSKYPSTDAISAFPFVGVIAALPPLLIVVTVMIGIFKIEEISRNLMPILLAIGGFTIITVAMIRKPLGVAAERYMEKRF